MKTLHLLTFFALFIAHHGFTQKKSETIFRIRQDFTNINTDTTLRIVTMDAEDFLENVPDGGGELKGFYRDQQLVKLVEWIGLSNGNSIREFYFTNGNLFFVYEKFDSFLQTKEGLDKSGTFTSFEARYYISKEKMVEKKLTGNTLRNKYQTVSSLKADAEEYRMKLSAVK